MPANILNLPAYTITALQEYDHDYHIDAEVRQAVTHCIHYIVLGRGFQEAAHQAKV